MGKLHRKEKRSARQINTYDQIKIVQQLDDDKKARKWNKARYKTKYPYYNGSSKHTSAITHLNLNLNLDLMFTFCIQRLGRGLIVTKDR